jgi:hypothetical protein
MNGWNRLFIVGTVTWLTWSVWYWYYSIADGIRLSNAIEAEHGEPPISLYEYITNDGHNTIPWFVGMMFIALFAPPAITYALGCVGAWVVRGFSK